MATSHYTHADAVVDPYSFPRGLHRAGAGSKPSGPAGAPPTEGGGAVESPGVPPPGVPPLVVLLIIVVFIALMAGLSALAFPTASNAILIIVTLLVPAVAIAMVILHDDRKPR